MLKLMQQSYDDMEAISLEVIDEMTRSKFILTEEQIAAFKEEYLMLIGEKGVEYFTKLKASERRKGVTKGHVF
jgi:hypothetical protein